MPWWCTTPFCVLCLSNKLLYLSRISLHPVSDAAGRRILVGASLFFFKFHVACCWLTYLLFKFQYVIKYLFYSSGQHITVVLANDPLLSMTGMGEVVWFVCF